MNTSTKFAGFTLGLIALFGTALGVGTLTGPPPGDRSEPHHSPAPGTRAAPEPGGRTAGAGGYTLVLDETTTQSRRDAILRFRIEDSEGRPVLRYTPNHEKNLHLILVRRDTTGYQHLHPALAADGTWSTPVDLHRAGDYRVLADFVTGDGQPLTLGTDLRVAGQYTPRPLPTPATTAAVGDYTVELGGSVEATRSTEITLTVSRGGDPVTDLQPYLGAYGHLVALRVDDLGYLHVHPDGHPGDGTTPAGPGVSFAIAAPGPGDYRLFFEFRHEGTVHRAEFTVPVDGSPAEPNDAHTAPTPAEPGHGH